LFATERRHKDENDKSQTNEPGKATEMVSTATPLAPSARSAASSATGGRVYIFVNSRRIREFLQRLRPAQIEHHNFLPS
jgi:hypothetical protein